MNWLQEQLNMYWNSCNDGLSPFHVACLQNNVKVISHLLMNNQIDVNQSVDSSAKSDLAGLSPLHLVLKSYKGDDSARLAIVDLLLKNGAQVNARDAGGETPLHYAVQLGSKSNFDILKKILEAGADVNAYRTSGDIPGVTAFDYLLCYKNYSTEELELFIKHGCRLNAYNPVSEGGYVAMAFVSRGSKSKTKRILFKAMQDYPHTIEPDEQGRTVIHSLVAHPGSSLILEEYVELIDELARMAGCDVDDQDKKGRTALCLAARHGNGRAIQGLLIAGADVNIIDNGGNSAFDYLKTHGSYASTPIVKQVRKLELVRLDLSKKNRDFAKNVQLDDRSLSEAVEKELELAKRVQIVFPSLTLRDFLYEFSPRTTTAIRENEAAIHEYFQKFEDERFVELRYLFKMQYRKIVTRLKLIEPALVALDVVSECSLLCAELIVRFLGNDDLNRLIKASVL